MKKSSHRLTDNLVAAFTARDITPKGIIGYYLCNSCYGKAYTSLAPTSAFQQQLLKRKENPNTKSYENSSPATKRQKRQELKEHVLQFQQDILQWQDTYSVDCTFTITVKNNLMEEQEWTFSITNGSVQREVKNLHILNKDQCLQLKNDLQLTDTQYSGLCTYISLYSLSTINRLKKLEKDELRKDVIVVTKSNSIIGMIMKLDKQIVKLVTKQDRLLDILKHLHEWREAAQLNSWKWQFNEENSELEIPLMIKLSIDGHAIMKKKSEVAVLLSIPTCKNPNSLDNFELAALFLVPEKYDTLKGPLVDLEKIVNNLNNTFLSESISIPLHDLQQIMNINTSSETIIIKFKLKFIITADLKCHLLLFGKCLDEEEGDCVWCKFLHATRHDEFTIQPNGTRRIQASKILEYLQLIQNEPAIPIKQQHYQNFSKYLLYEIDMNEYLQLSNDEFFTPSGRRRQLEMFPTLRPTVRIFDVLHLQIRLCTHFIKMILAVGYAYRKAQSILQQLREDGFISWNETEPSLEGSDCEYLMQEEVQDKYLNIIGNHWCKEQHLQFKSMWIFLRCIFKQLNDLENRYFNSTTLHDFAILIDKYLDLIVGIGNPKYVNWLQKSESTPWYLHILNTHVIIMLFTYKNLSMFSMQGHEHNNKKLKRIYNRNSAWFGGKHADNVYKDSQGNDHHETNTSATMFSVLYSFNKQQE